jgi:hypothetical protein
LADRARAEAGSEPVGSHHFLLALLGDPLSLGARLLESLGVTTEAVRDRVAAMGVSGTSDELPPPPAPSAVAPLFEVAIGGLTIRVDDEAMADELKAAIMRPVEAGLGGTEIEAAVRERLAEMLRPSPEPPAEGEAEGAS